MGCPTERPDNGYDREAIAAHYRKLWESCRLTGRVELITPDIAARDIAWTDARFHNRPKIHGAVKRYTSFILGCRWVPNGESVIYDEDNCLIDGRNRYEAIIAAGVPVPLFVVRGVPQEYFATMGQGVGRSLGHILAIKHTKNYTKVAAALRWLYRYEEGYMQAFHSEYIPSNDYLAEVFLPEHPGLPEAVDKALSLCRRGFASPGLFSFLYYKCGELHPDQPELLKFFERALLGLQLEPKTPEHTLHRVLFENQKSKSKLPESHIAAIAIKGWNAHLKTRPVSVLKFLDSEEFPDIQ